LIVGVLSKLLVAARSGIDVARDAEVGRIEEGRPVEVCNVVSATTFDDLFELGLSVCFVVGRALGVEDSVGDGSGVEAAGAVIVVYPPTGPSKVFEAVTYTIDTSVCAGDGSAAGEAFASAKGLGRALARASAHAFGSGQAARAWRR
jgi:hypothetical protein